ncbi:MAG: YdcF family protein [Bacteroidia bacterium]|nr:YdcF family protein [Bacteroidia bacterium]MDW8301680.1 ElyC/SanA/YdcF family protein [Bacteroidia bacterium]
MVLGSVILVVAFLIWAKWHIKNTTRAQIVRDVHSVPYHKTALVLGTSRYLPHHIPNMYFNYRIQAACELYFAQKVSYIIVSGDNRSAYYNEPRDMQQALIEKGVPKKAIIMDYGGIHTLDSVIRCKKIFGQDKCIIVSQEFHVARALFLANHSGMNCVGYPAKDIPLKDDYKTHLREYLACAKAVLNMYLFRPAPKYLGNPVRIDTNSVHPVEKGGA